MCIEKNKQFCCCCCCCCCWPGKREGPSLIADETKDRSNCLVCMPFAHRLCQSILLTTRRKCHCWSGVCPADHCFPPFCRIGEMPATLLADGRNRTNCPSKATFPFVDLVAFSSSSYVAVCGFSFAVATALEGSGIFSFPSATSLKC